MVMDGKWLSDHSLTYSHTPNLEMLLHLKIDLTSLFLDRALLFIPYRQILSLSHSVITSMLVNLTPFQPDVIEAGAGGTKKATSSIVM